MGKKAIIIKVSNDKIYFNAQLSIPIQHTNIPKDHLTFRTHEDIFWKVEMLEYKHASKSLKVKVTDYRIEYISEFDNQIPKKDINELLFEKFDWKELEPILSGYRKIQLKEILFNMESDNFSKGYPQSSKSHFNNLPTTTITTGSKSNSTIITKEFWIPFTNCIFMLGCVTFKKRIKSLSREIDFSISNEHMLAEFNNVKIWFAKKLKTKKFKTTVEIILTGDEVIETSAISDHIDQITPELIDNVRYLRTLALTKESQNTIPGKALFTSEEIFDQINTNNIESNVFNQSEQDILSLLIQEDNIRNKMQLSYLAGKQKIENCKLLFTLKPNFGFLFLVEGKENNHFVWELLNSHATYIWSINKEEEEIGLQFKQIENIINTIRVNGRDNYKKAFKNNDIEGLQFRVINHTEAALNQTDAFLRWKSKLKEQLT
jgi:hypothetical protein